MSKRRRKSNSPSSANPAEASADEAMARGDEPPPGESRASQAVTVLWMMLTLGTLLAGLGTLVAAGLLLGKALGDEGEQFLRLLAMLLYLTAVICGALTLIMTAVVRAVREGPTPLGITVAALVIGGIPPFTLAAAWITSWVASLAQ